MSINSLANCSKEYFLQMQNIKMKNGNQLLSKEESKIGDWRLSRLENYGNYTEKTGDIGNTRQKMHFGLEQRKAEPKTPATESVRRLTRIDPRKSKFKIPGKQQPLSDGEQEMSESSLTNRRTSLPYRLSGSDLVKRSSSTKVKHNVLNPQFDAIFTATSQKSTTKEICYFRSRSWKHSGRQSRVWTKNYEEDDNHGSGYDRRNDYVENQKETPKHFYGYENYNRSVNPYKNNNYHNNNSNQYRPLEKRIYTDDSWKCSSSDRYRPYHNAQRSRIPSRITSRITTCGERSERRTTYNLYEINNTNKREPLPSLNNSEKTSEKLFNTPVKETFVTKNGKYSSITKDSCATTTVVEEKSNEKDSVKASKESSLYPCNNEKFLSSVINFENSVVPSEKKNKDVAATESNQVQEDSSKNLIEFDEIVEDVWGVVEQEIEIISQPIYKDYDDNEVSMEIDSDCETVYFDEAVPYETELTIESINTNSTFLNCNLKSIVQSSNTNESIETTKSSKVENTNAKIDSSGCVMESPSTNEERDSNQGNSKQLDFNVNGQKSDSELTTDSINTNATFLNDYFESFVTAVRSIQSSNINHKKTKETEETSKSSEVENTNAKNDRSGCVMESPSTNKEQNSSKQLDYSVTERKRDSGSKTKPKKLKPESNSSNKTSRANTSNNDQSLPNENINISPAKITNTVIPTIEEFDEKDPVKSQVKRKRSIVGPLEISEDGKPKRVTRARSRNLYLESTSLPDKLPSKHTKLTSKRHSRSKSKSSFTCCSVPSKEVNKLIIRRKRQIIRDPSLKKESDLPMCSYKSSSPDQKKHLSSKPNIIPTSPNTDALDSRLTTQVPSASNQKLPQTPKDLSNEGKKTNVVSLTEYTNSYQRTPATERTHTISPTITSHMSFLFGSDDSDDNNRAKWSPRNDVKYSPKLDTNTTKNGSSKSKTKEHSIPTTSNHQLLASLNSKVSPRLSLEPNQKEDSENSSKELPQRTEVQNGSRRNSIESVSKTKPVQKRKPLLLQTDSNKAENNAEIPLVGTTNKKIIETLEQRSLLSTPNITVSNNNKSEKIVEIGPSSSGKENVALEPLQKKIVKTVEKMIQRRPSNIKFSELLAARLSADNEEMLEEPDKKIPEVVEQRRSSLLRSPNGESLLTEKSQSVASESSDKKVVKTIKNRKPLLLQATNGEQLSTKRPVGKEKSSNSLDTKVSKSIENRRPAIHVLSNVVVNQAKIPIQRRSSLLQATSNIMSNGEQIAENRPSAERQLSNKVPLNTIISSDNKGNDEKSMESRQSFAKGNVRKTRDKKQLKKFTVIEYQVVDQSRLPIEERRHSVYTEQRKTSVELNTHDKKEQKQFTVTASKANKIVHQRRPSVEKRQPSVHTEQERTSVEQKVQHAFIGQLSDQCFLDYLSNLEIDVPELKTARLCKQARKIKPCDVTIMPVITWEEPVDIRQPSTDANENSINQPVASETNEGVIDLCDSDKENEIRNVDFVNNLMREVIENKLIIQPSPSTVTPKEEPVETLMDISDGEQRSSNTENFITASVQDGLSLEPIQIPVRITVEESSDTAADVDTPIPVVNIEQPNLTISPVVRQNLGRVAVSNVEQVPQRTFYENISPPAPYFRQTNYNNQVVVGTNNNQGIAGPNKKQVGPNIYQTNNKRFVGPAVKTVTHTQFANALTMKILLYIDACELKNQLMDVYRNYEMTEESLAQEFQFYDLGLREKLKQFADYLLNYLNIYQVKNFNFKTFLLLVHKCADKNLRRSVLTRQVVWVLVQALRLYKDLCMANTGFLNEVYFQTIILWQQDVEYLERTRLAQAGTLMSETQKAVFYQQCQQYYLLHIALWGNQARQPQQKQQRRMRASISATSSSLQQPLQSSVQLRPSCSMQSQPQPHLQLPVLSQDYPSVQSERISTASTFVPPAPQAERNTQNISLQSLLQQKPQRSAISHYTNDDFKIRLSLSNPYEPQRMTRVIATDPAHETVPTLASATEAVPAVKHTSSLSPTASDCIDDVIRQTLAVGTSNNTNSVSIKQEAEEVDENVIDVDKWYAETNVIRQTLAAGTSNSTNSHTIKQEPEEVDENVIDVDQWYVETNVIRQTLAAGTSNSTNSHTIKQEPEEVDENVIDVDKWYAQTNVIRQTLAAGTSNSTNSVSIKQEAEEVDENVIDVDKWYAETNVIRQTFAAGTSNSTNSVSIKQEAEEVDENVIDVDKWYAEKMMTEDVVCLNSDYFDLSHFIKTDFDVYIKTDDENNQEVGTGDKLGTEQVEPKPEPQKKQQQQQQKQPQQQQPQQQQQKQQQQQQLMANRSHVRIASADSGFSSPLRQIEHPEILSGGRTCICFKKAELVCECRVAIYCSQECQIKEWPNHREQCYRAREDHCKKMGIL